MTTSISLKAEMMALSGWTSCRIQRDMEMLAASFELGMVNPQSLGAAADLKPYHHVEISLNNRPYLRGFIDEPEDGYEESSSDWRIQGRSESSMLVDCEAPVGTWKNTALNVIVSDICDHLGVDVSFRTPATQVIRKFVTQEGERGAEAIKRLCDATGILPLSDPLGGLKLEQTGTGTHGVPITQGAGVIISGRRRRSGMDRYSQYTYKSQTAGNDNWSGAAASRIKHQVSDAEVLRFRPLTIIADTEQSQEELEVRATWDRNRRAGHSYTLSYTVRGWEFGGATWEPNHIYPINDKRFSFAGPMLLVGVTLLQEGEDQTAELHFVDPAAYSGDPTARVSW